MHELTKWSDRVRGIVRTRRGDLLLIKRSRPNVPNYWVFPGGGVEAEDVSATEALKREIREELGCEADVGRLVYILKRPEKNERELYFLVRIADHNERERSGPEFDRANSGEYAYDEFPVALAELRARNIKPEVVADWLETNLDRLDGLPDRTDDM